MSLDEAKISVKHVPQCLSGSAPVSEMLYRQKQCILLLLLSQKCINKLNSFYCFTGLSKKTTDYCRMRTFESRIIRVFYYFFKMRTYFNVLYFSVCVSSNLVSHPMGRRRPYKNNAGGGCRAGNPASSNYVLLEPNHAVHTRDEKNFTLRRLRVTAFNISFVALCIR